MHVLFDNKTGMTAVFDAGGGEWRTVELRLDSEEWKSTVKNKPFKLGGAIEMAWAPFRMMNAAGKYMTIDGLEFVMAETAAPAPAKPVAVEDDPYCEFPVGQAPAGWVGSGGETIASPDVAVVKDAAVGTTSVRATRARQGPLAGHPTGAARACGSHEVPRRLLLCETELLPRP